MAKLENLFSEIAAQIGRFCRNFILAYAVVIALGLLTAVAVYYVGASNGSSARGMTSALLAIALFLIAGFPVVTQLSSFLTLAQLVGAKKWGSQILNALFEELTGVTPEKPEGDRELTQKLHGTPVREVRTRLRVAARSVIQSRLVTATTPFFARTIARQIARVLVWVTVRVIVSNCAAGHGPDDTVDMLVIRDRLGARIDGMVIQRLQQNAIRVSFLVAMGLIVASYLLAVAVLKLPSGWFS